MSLAIDVDHVTHVLIAGTWHEVADTSFVIDAHEFISWNGPRINHHGDDNDPHLMHGGGQHNICASGFSFETTDGDYIAGPLDRITAVRYTS